MEMNKHEYKLYKQYLKSEVMQKKYKEIINDAKFIQNEHEQKNNKQVSDTNTNIKNEKNEMPKITIEFRKIFLILSKEEEVLINLLV